MLDFYLSIVDRWEEFCTGHTDMKGAQILHELDIQLALVSFQARYEPTHEHVLIIRTPLRFVVSWSPLVWSVI